MARAGAGLAAIEYGNRRTARRKPPRDAEPDDARTDDGDAWLLCGRWRVVRQERLPSLE
jgi:hypothetical protein